MKIRVGSRESKLAVVQSEMVIEKIKKACPDAEIELITMKTTGDIILDRTLDKVGGKGLFVKELEKALLENRVDLVVHSFKDVPMLVNEELPIIGVMKRHDPRDVMVFRKNENGIDRTKPIGCSSFRRTLQLKKLYPDVPVKSVRGNVLTRLEKLDSGEYGSIVLAKAGLERLSLEDRIGRVFEAEEILPAACQGVLAIQSRKDFNVDFLNTICDEETFMLSKTERAFVRTLDGGCSSPVAAYATMEGEKISLRGLYYDENEKSYCIETICTDRENSEKDAIKLAKKLKGCR